MPVLLGRNTFRLILEESFRALRMAGFKFWKRAALEPIMRAGWLLSTLDLLSASTIILNELLVTLGSDFTFVCVSPHVLPLPGSVGLRPTRVHPVWVVHLWGEVRRRDWLLE